MEGLDGLALFFFVFFRVLDEAGVVFADGVNEAFVLIDFVCVEGVGFGHSP